MELGIVPTQKSKDSDEPKKPTKGKGGQPAETSGPTHKRPRTVQNCSWRFLRRLWRLLDPIMTVAKIVR